MTGSLLPPREPEEGAAPPAEGGVGFAAIPEGQPAGSPPIIPPPEMPTPTVAIGAPGDPGDPGGPQPPALQAPPPKKKSSAGLVLTFIGVAGAAIVAILVKFVLPLALAGVAGQVIDSAFGGPYGRLPGDVRSGFESRLEAAVGDRIKDQTDAQQAATILALVKSGLSRLDNALVDSNFRLTSKALDATDIASCAAVARAIVGGGEPPESASSAMINTLSDADLRQWFEIRISAIEADVRGSPAQVMIEDSAVDPLYDKLFKIMSSDDIETFGGIAGGEDVTDDALCTAVRSLYASVLTLSAEETTLFARYDVSP